MSQAVAYGSITICDIGDLGELSVQPMSNRPLAVIYDPNQSTFTPDWSSSNLVLTPSIYYGGTSLTAGISTGLTVTWERQEGAASATALQSGETVGSDGKLTVSANKFTASSTMITYIVTATYQEPTAGVTLTSKGQITFTLVKNASSAKNISITGDSIFKYNTSQSLVGESSIVLTANTSNVAISNWVYLDENSVWQDYVQGGSTSTTLTVNASDNVFVNDKCVIKVLTDDANVYDVHTITKLRDGVAGSSTVSAVLTNDDQMLPSSNGHVSDYGTAVSRIIIYEGGDDVTSQWTKTVSKSPSSITVVQSQNGSQSSNGDTVSVTNIPDSVTSCTVTFTCTRSGYNQIVKTFSVVKVEAGADGDTPIIYSVEADALAINQDIEGTFTPAAVTFRAYAQEGNNPKTAYSGRFKIWEDVTLTASVMNGTASGAKYTSQNNESSYTYTPSSSASSIVCVLYQAGATSTYYDSQTVVVTRDGPTGATGSTGAAGASAVNVVLGNYADVLTCTNSNVLSAQQIIKIPFAAYEGTSRIACQFTSVKLLNVSPNAIGTGTNSSKQATTTSDGQIVWTLPANTAVSAASGTLAITFTATTSGGTTVTVVENYSWSRSTAAANAVLLQIFTPSGTNVFAPGVASITMQGQLLDGSTDATSSATYQWAKWQSGAYTNVSGATSSSLAVASSSVDSYASYRLTATYNTHTYLAYFSLFDKTDPIQVAVLSSVGTQLINGAGYGALYVKVSRNGSEIDAIKSESFLTSAPSSPSSGDYYYLLNTSEKSATLKQYNGSSWVTVSNPYTGTYTWSWRDKDGNAITTYGTNNTALPTTGKVLYIDGDMVDSKIIADVEVTI